jgi:hypothetical protein
MNQKTRICNTCGNEKIISNENYKTSRHKQCISCQYSNLKKCNECNQVKDLENFYNKNFGKCKDCMKLIINKKEKEKEKIQVNKKKCSQCNEIKEIQLFGKNKKNIYCLNCQQNIIKTCSICNKIGGFNLFNSKGNYCKECQREYDRQYREKNKEYIRERDKNYRKENPEVIKERKKQYYKNNKEIIQEKNKKYVEKNQEKILKYKKEYYESNKDIINKKKKEHYHKNKEEILQKQREYNQKNKEHISKNKKEYYKNNKEIIQEKNKNSYRHNIFKSIVRNTKSGDKKNKRENDLSEEFIQQMYENQEGKCYYCNMEILLEIGYRKLNQIFIDRVNNELGHIKDNVCISCLHCNHSKNINTKEKYLEYLNILKGKEILKQKSKQKKIYWEKELFKTCNRTNKNINITIEWIKNQYIIQEGLCFYSNILMIPSEEKYNLFQPSLEKINSELGYDQENCVLTLLGINLGKNNSSPEELLEYLENLREI